MERGSRTRLATAGILAVVFGAGVLLGLAVDRTVVASPSREEVAERQDPEERQQDTERRRRYIYEQVIDPTEGQQATIDSALGAWRQNLRELNAVYGPQFDVLEDAYDVRRDSLRRELREGIMEVMTPAQAEEYRTLLEAYDRRQAQRREGRDK